MSILSRLLLGTAIVVAMTWNTPAHALSMHDCRLKYRSEQTAQTLNGMSWKEFQKAECGPGAAAAPMSTNAATAPAAAPTLNTAEQSNSTRIHDPVPTGGPAFPTAVSPKYAGQSAGRARMLTCLDQYKANKADNMNGSLRWIQKGGGYYSMCNRHLKRAGE